MIRFSSNPPPSILTYRDLDKSLYAYVYDTFIILHRVIIDYQTEDIFVKGGMSIT